MTSMDADSQMVFSSIEPHTVRGALLDGTQLIRAAGIDSARLDVEVLMCHALGFGKSQLYLSLDEQLDDAVKDQFDIFLMRRLRREPVAYIIRCQEFWSLDFRVTPDVLIPRPETERLVEIALNCAGAFDGGLPLRILDIGTGSGAIAVSLAKELPQAQLWATDVSSAALEVARHNAACHRVAERIQFAGSDLFDSVRESGFHLIVSNPPYVRRGEIANLTPEVSRWEPRSALDGGADGLDYYRGIIREANRHLLPGGALIMEIGADLGRPVAQLLSDAGNYTAPKIYQDYACRDRVVVAYRPAADVGTSAGGLS
jgi:release factor glutamine methyltransferase